MTFLCIANPVGPLKWDVSCQPFDQPDVTNNDTQDDYYTFA